MRGEALQERKSRLSDAKQKLLGKLWELPSVTTPLRGAISCGVKQPWYPTSFQQKRLWFASQIDSDVPIYNLVRAFRLNGPLDIEILKKALEELVGRHAILRTTFSMREGDPVQVVKDEIELPFFYVDLRAIASKVRAAEATAFLEREARTQFDLSTGPLMRFSLVQLQDQEHFLVVAMHHIVTDDWSIRIFFRELSAVYHAFLAGQRSPLPVLPISYTDFAVWQNSHVEAQENASQISYWRQQLAGISPALNLPTKPKLPKHSHAGARLSFPVAKPLWRTLEQLCQAGKHTLFEVLLGAFQVLLAYYTGDGDVVVGTIVSSRDREELEPLMGFLVNTLVLRGNISGDLSFIQVLRQARETLLDAHKHKQLPFELLVRELQPERTNVHAPLFQIMFSIQNLSDSDLVLEGVRAETIPVEYGSTVFDLNFVPERSSDGLNLALQYNTSIFEESTIRRFVAHYQKMLEMLAVAPERRVSEVCVLNDDERQQVVEEWNDTQQQIPELCLHQLFEEQVLRTPHAVALVFADKRLTYTELNGKANQLAHFLRTWGVQTETPVAICCERSLELVIGILGILKAGGVYVPLDASYPTERLGWMLDDCHAPILLTQENLLRKMPSHWVQMIAMDTESDRIAAESPANPTHVTIPANLAYVMYTSGSTGTPKGVAVEHRAIVRLALGTRAFTVAPSDAFVLLSPVTFDASTLEIWAPLLHGARLAVFPAVTPSSKEIGEFVEKAGVTVLWLTAGLFHQLVETELPRLQGIRQLLTGGDVVSPRHIRMLAQMFPGCVLINGYGPTENTTFTACHVIQGDPGPLNSFPIGKPISNTTAYVLDAQMKPLPVGVVGELFTGGMGLARGYLDSPDLTAEKFLPNPFSKIGGERLYRTGDRVRWQSDGTLEFLGRFDFQVKLRGFRIELGEVQAVLEKVAGVRQALAVLHEYSPADKRLVAYVAVDPGTPATDECYLRSYMQERLPPYMVPGAILILGELPLTHNGKVNRKALPAPECSNKKSAGDAPRTPIEEIVAGIWCEILKVDSAGIHDSFFDLGGHSLLATQLISRIRLTFQVELSLSVLFEKSTIAAFAARLEEEVRKDKKSAMPPMRHVNRETSLPLSFAQQRLWFLHQLQPESSAYNVPIALRLQGEIQVETLERAVTELVRRHQVLRTRLEMAGQQTTQVIAPATPVHCALTDLSMLSSEKREAEARLQMAAEARAPFDLAHGPLIRGRIFRLTSTDHLLLITLHHVACDGWSLGIMMREITALYGAYSAGQESPLPELMLQYADYAAVQREWLQGEVLEEQLSYWKKQLAGLPVLEIPTDFPRTHLGSEAGAALPWTLNEELSRQLKELSRREGVTLFMTMLAAFQLLLSRYSGQEDVAVGTPIAGRRWTETENLIGFFVNTLVLRTDTSGAPTFREMLGRVRATTLGAHAYQDIPFEKLVEELRPERDLSRTPFFQVLFVFQNAPETELHFPDVKVSRLEIPLEVTKFELALMATESGSRIEGALGYRTGLFAETRMKRLLGHWENLLTEIVRDPQARISDLQFLGPEECRQLLGGNRAQRRHSESRLLQQVFEEQAQINPLAIAAQFEGRKLTYAELNCRANQLGHYLKKSGIGPEALVGMFMERGLGIVIGLLAVLKAGGAYVPLDPDYPAERISYMLQDAGVKVLIADSSTESRIDRHSVTLVNLDRDWEEISRESQSNPTPEATPESVAYVIYTSGSTGRPKGVAVTHGNVSRLFASTQHWFQFSSNDVWTMFHSYAFDFSVWEIWGALLYGGRLLVVPYHVSRAPAAFRAMLLDEEVTVLNQTPSAFRQLVQLEETSEVTDQKMALRLVIFGGEALDIPSLRPWFARHGSQSPRLVNMYGITETTVHVTYQPLTSKMAQDQASVIGGPIPDLQVFLLDRYMQPVPIGVAGEMFIGGAGLARGYLNRPELTAERFVPNPFSACEGERLYRSGDKARFREDGALEYLGRIDFQVKVRGYRIELGEIEAALQQYQSVQQAVVVAYEDHSPEKRLVAYVVKKASQEDLRLSGLRSHLEELLPAYMVPAAFIELVELPLTPNGKIDRKALPNPGTQDRVSETVFIAPQNELEKAVAAIWQELLHVDNVSVFDNFFDLGGHSLLVIQVHAALRQMNQPVSITDLFKFPTIASLAQHLSQVPAQELRSEIKEDAELERLKRGKLRLATRQRKPVPVD
jgi:amino acid adenylation domain-containing protein